jgi:peptidylprolyl isomerase
MRRPTHPLLPLVLAAALAACGDSGSPTEPEDVSFDASLGIDLSVMTKLPSGVYIHTVTPGSGDRQLTVNDNWTIEYRFWLTNGTLVDEGPLRSELDCLQGCIQGFEEGIVGMRVGEVRKIVIPSRLGYGDEPPAGESRLGERVPPNAVLVYETRLVGLR